MSAPKTIYVHRVICDVIENGEHGSTARLEKRWPQDIEYRLVDPNEQSKIQRIKEEILSRHGYFIDDGEGNLGNYQSEESIIEIIDRIGSE